jgi:predicted nucleotidyltransferase component of viral defense system
VTQLKDQARSVTDRLSKLARESKTPYAKILTEFLLERLAVRLVSAPDLGGRLVFKGGYVSLRVYDSPRYTIDLDALLRRGSLESVTLDAQVAAESDFGDGAWFRLEKTVDLETQGEYGGLRLVLRAGLGEALPKLKKAQIVHLDIGKGDPVTPAPIEVETPYLLGRGSLSWRVYPVETTVAEKLHALIVRGSESSRSKDIFDLSLLLEKCDGAVLKRALQETFRHRGDELPSDLKGYLEKIDRRVLKMGWKSAVGDVPSAPDFDEYFDQVVAQAEGIMKKTRR